MGVLVPALKLPCELFNRRTASVLTAKSDLTTSAALQAGSAGGGEALSCVGSAGGSNPGRSYRQAFGFSHLSKSRERQQNSATTNLRLTYFPGEVRAGS
jgi:hypothetical protein